MVKKYEVWGFDTFAHEDYLCGTYKTRSEVDNMMRKMVRRVQGQNSSLRDSFSILVTDDGDVDEGEDVIIEADYNSGFLNQVVDNL